MNTQPIDDSWESLVEAVAANPRTLEGLGGANYQRTLEQIATADQFIRKAITVIWDIDLDCPADLNEELTRAHDELMTVYGRLNDLLPGDKD